jgi:hypothetical protein
MYHWRFFKNDKYTYRGYIMGTLTFTTATIITWASYEDQMDNIDLDDARAQKLTEMTTAGKTDGEAIILTPASTKRFFVDVVSAQEYIDFMVALSIQYGVTIVSTEIQENAV